MERISKKPTPDCPLCGWSRKDHPMATHEWATKTGECAGEDREPCLLRQLAAANEKLADSARLATESAQLADGMAKDLAAANERAGRLEAQMGDAAQSYAQMVSIDRRKWQAAAASWDLLCNNGHIDIAAPSPAIDDIDEHFERGK